MKKLNLKNAKDFALDKLNKLSDLYQQFIIIHVESMIKVIKTLNKDKKIDEDKLFSLAWVHDIGKVISENDHAKHSLEILNQEFELDEIDIDCILNHGSSSNPKTKERKLFHYADGLSMFTKDSINFRFYAESKEGYIYDEIKERLNKIYEKYQKTYSNSEKVLELLNSLYFT